MMNQNPIFAIMINRSYGPDNPDYGKHLIGVAFTRENAMTIMHNAFEIAKDAFVAYMRNSGNIAYRVYDNETVEAFDMSANENSMHIEMYIHDDTAPYLESVTVYIEDSMLYTNHFAADMPNMEHLHDNQTGIDYVATHCDLTQHGFVQIAAQTNMQNKIILFWKNEVTGEVAISLKDSESVPTRIFKNRDDGNRWFKTYIKPMHGSNINKYDIERKENTFIIITVRDYGRNEPGRNIVGSTNNEATAMAAMHRIFDDELKEFQEYIENHPMHDMGKFDICCHPTCSDKACSAAFIPTDPDGLFDFSVRVWIETIPIIT